MKISKTDASYFAAFFDADGGVGLYPVVGRVCYSSQVNISNTNKDILELYKKSFGGNIYKRIKYKTNHRQCRDWRLSDKKDVLYFLKTVIPFLKQKKRQAELLQEYYNTTYGSGRHRSPELIKSHKKLMNEIKKEKVKEDK